MTEIEALRKLTMRVKNRIPVLIGEIEDGYIVRTSSGNEDIVDGGGYYLVTRSEVSPIMPYDKRFPRDIKFKQIKFK